jgi:hypothetical protein
MASARISACPIDFFHDHRRLRQTKAGPAVLFRDQGGHPPLTGYRVDEILRIPTRFVNPTVVLRRELRTKGADTISNIPEVVFHKVHSPCSH